MATVRHAAIVLLAVLHAGCGPGCEVLTPEQEPTRQLGALASHLTPSGLTARGRGLVRALAGLPADRLTVAVDGAEGPLTDHTRFRYQPTTVQLEPYSGHFGVSAEDGTVIATVSFLPLEVSVDAEEVFLSGVLAYCPVTASLVSLELTVDLDPTAEQRFLIADAELLTGEIDLEAQAGCAFRDPTPVTEALTAGLAEALQRDLGSSLPRQIRDLAPGLLGLDLDAYRAFRLSSTLPPTKTVALEYSLSPEDDGVRITDRGLALRVAAGFADRPPLEPPVEEPFFPDLAPDGEPYHYAVAVRLAHLEDGLALAHDDGYFAVDVTSPGLGSTLTTSDLGLADWLPEAPFFLRVRPQTAPHLLSGPHLVFEFGTVQLDLYAELDEAYVRALGGTATGLRVSGQLGQGLHGPRFTATGFEAAWTPQFTELFGDPAGPVVEAFVGALAQAGETFLAAYLDLGLPTPLTELDAPLFRAAEVRGDHEPYLYLYLDLDPEGD